MRNFSLLQLGYHTIYGILLCFLVAEVIFYPHLVAKYIKIDSSLLLFGFLIISLFLKLKQKIKDQKTFLRINLYGFLPLSSLGLVYFSILEYIHYPNYVLQTFHIHYQQFVFIILLSMIMSFIHTETMLLKKNYKTYIFFSAPLLLVLFSFIRLFPMDVFFQLVKEDGIIEYGQSLFYFLSSVFALLICLKFRKLKVSLLFCLYLCMSLGFFFVAGEEISWGQRIFHIATPSALEQVNMQQEMNIHNISSLDGLVPRFYMILGFVGGTLWMFQNIFKKKYSRLLFSFFAPPWYTCYYFLSAFLYNFYTSLGEHSIGEWSEVAELMLAMGIWIFIVQVYYTLKSLRKISLPMNMQIIYKLPLSFLSK